MNDLFSKYIIYIVNKYHLYVIYLKYFKIYYLLSIVFKITYMTIFHNFRYLWIDIWVEKKNDYSSHYSVN